MTTVSARDASRGFAALLDRVARDGEEYTVVRDGKEIARIVPVSAHAAADFLTLRRAHGAVDDAFAADAESARELLTVDTADPWRD